MKVIQTLTDKEIKASLLIIIIYSVGIVGITIPFTNEIFLRLIPSVIILSLIVSLFYHKRPFDIKMIVVFLIIIILTWIIEAAGVAKGVIFGRYAYGPSLGIKILETPVLIGFNWLFLIYGTASLTEKLPVGVSLKIVLAAVILVIYDIVLETVAPLLGMWYFDEGHAPVRNYAAWFFITVLLHSILKIFRIRINNHISEVIFLVQFLFFLALMFIFQIKQ